MITALKVAGFILLGLASVSLFSALLALILVGKHLKREQAA